MPTRPQTKGSEPDLHKPSCSNITEKTDRSIFLPIKHRKTGILEHVASLLPCSPQQLPACHKSCCNLRHKLSILLVATSSETQASNVMDNVETIRSQTS